MHHCDTDNYTKLYNNIIITLLNYPIERWKSQNLHQSGITTSVAIMLLFAVRSLAVTARLAVGEFMCNKPSLNRLLANSTGDIRFNRLSDILAVPVALLHIWIREHCFLLHFLYQFLMLGISHTNSWRWKSLCALKVEELHSTVWLWWPSYSHRNRTASYMHSETILF